MLKQNQEGGVLPKAFSGTTLSGDAADQRLGFIEVKSESKSMTSLTPNAVITRTSSYRSHITRTGEHFYTISETERAHVVDNLPQNSHEGVGYYVLADESQIPSVPDRGVTSNLCCQAGSDALVTCSCASKLALKRLKMGIRLPQRHMYNPPDDPQAGECMCDYLTGLIWAVKAANGVRAWINIGDKSAASTLPTFLGKRLSTARRGQGPAICA